MLYVTYINIMTCIPDVHVHMCILHMYVYMKHLSDTSYFAITKAANL